MDVSVTALRAELARWIEQVRDGEEIVITERGVPVARLTAVDATPVIEQLTRDGVLSRPRRPERPRATQTKRVRATRPVSDLVDDQRR